MSPQRKSPEDDIGRRAQRLKKTRENAGVSPLRGLGVFGMIGWSVAVPTAGGAFLGLWLDRTIPQNFPWVLALILGGVTLGSFIAWAWIGRESAEEEDSHDDH
ncbi:AtpZ/AtpI family protein [Halomonas sp. ISL-60]|uniref:AtpZ/AtpI family protein n=1 Tax=Halomonas sp. ISL-56 TaxID=2819149 RepID=UPI001BE9650F|nr:AtpZ/AtpI family protein [Halomonas sp. ISL-56]MBT2775180.1 AtpZ/AtpI family protein [Halomonas sp. ISL-60]MBT2799933.1 AtpZ/AtpI family protein [Halomonas sp. ISL-56]